MNPDTRRRVQEAAEQLDYLVNKSASLLSRRTDVSICIALADYPEHFWKQIEQGVWDAYKELRDFGLRIEIVRTGDDADKNVQILQAVMEKEHFGGLALAATSDAYIGLVDTAVDKGTAVCTLNIDSPTSKRLFYVGGNYHNAGRLAAELVCKFIGRRGKVAIVTDSWTSFQSQQKITGFREGLLEFPLVNMVGPLKMERDYPEESLVALKEPLSSVDGIYVSNAELGVIAKLGLHESIVLVGHDMNNDIYRGLNGGAIAATICQDPVRQGYLAVQKLFNYVAMNEEVDVRENVTNLEVVLKGNSSFYI